MLRFKVEPLVLLKAKGISATKLRKDATFGGATIQKIRHKRICSMNELNRLCGLLDVQPGELIEYVKMDETETKVGESIE